MVSRCIGVRGGTGRVLKADLMRQSIRSNVLSTLMRGDSRKGLGLLGSNLLYHSNKRLWGVM